MTCHASILVSTAGPNGMRGPSTIRAAVFALFVAFAVPADGEAAETGGTLHVCVDARGARSYQDTPCAASMRRLGAREFVRAPIDPTLAAHTRAVEAEMDRRNRERPRQVVVRGTSRPAAPDPCRAAKARREATLKRVGLKRNFDLLSRLDGEVWEVCKGF